MNERNKYLSKLFDNKLESEIQKVKKLKHSKFEEEPVTPKEFFEEWMRMPLFPSQYSLVNHIFTEGYQDLREDINIILLRWGQSSGKNTTCARTLVYIAYWLMCLHNPQEYLGAGHGTPIVLCNVSFREEHASGIFFNQFTNYIKNVINPRTGKNWFAEKGVDLRDGKGIQTRKVVFTKHIEATSESSVRYTAEGKNVLVAIFDEIAEFRYDKAKALFDNLKNTAMSRFPHHYKLIAISYPRDPNDFFQVLYEGVEDLPEEDRRTIYRETKAVWEVRSKKDAHPLLIKKRIYRLKEDYMSAYRTDPVDAMRRYECKFPKNTADRFLKRFDIVLDKCINFERPIPYIREEEDDKSFAVTDEELLHLTWQPWFRPYYSYERYLLEQQYDKTPTKELKDKIDLEIEKHENSIYTLHVDLSSGKVDYAGLVLLHTYQKTPSTRGYYIDLALQIKAAENDEIQFERIQKFIVYLSSKGFNLVRVSFDGFQSTFMLQNLNNKGIEASVVSVDRSRKPYDTLKHVLYQGLVDIYYFPPLIRELKELRVNAEKNKIDHPKESLQRLREEGIKTGSKDVCDSLSGAIYSAITYDVGDGISVVDTRDTNVDHLINDSITVFNKRRFIR